MCPNENSSFDEAETWILRLLYDAVHGTLLIDFHTPIFAFVRTTSNRFSTKT